LYEYNISDKMAQFMHEKTGVPVEAISCKGCRAQNGVHFHIPNGCLTLNCAKERDVKLCSDCDDFPCAMLAPLADGAERFPHNFKLYNLCRIKKIGIDQWITESADIRR
jgi:hypothetical protein